jgi:hypothetical protein
MSEWMEYIHMQQPKPTNATGVSVKLTAIDPNGNFQNIGTATSDIFGNYAISWIPPVPGLYKVTATFEGSESYYGSDAGTSFAVTEAAAAPNIVPTQPPEETTAPTSTIPAQTTSPSPTQAVQPPSATPMETYIAIGAVAVIAIVAAAAIVLKRRKH